MFKIDTDSVSGEYRKSFIYKGLSDEWLLINFWTPLDEWTGFHIQYDDDSTFVYVNGVLKGVLDADHKGSCFGGN